ncbi:MAG: tetratricopeptide repeat protein [Deltaproteobacteria bacterium]|nr:tetratricopeptide repeat protein [Deltaproteobacteria bacterium]
MSFESGYGPASMGQDSPLGVSESSATWASQAYDRLAFAITTSGALDPDAFAQVEEALGRAKRFADLALSYGVAIERAPTAELGRTWMLRSALLELERGGDLTLAERRLRAILSSEPDLVAALDVYARVCVARGRVEQALDLLERAIEGAPGDERPELALDLADLACRVGEIDRAIEALRFAFQGAPTRTDVLRRAYEILIDQARLVEARQILDVEREARFGHSPPVTEEQQEAYAELGAAYRDLGVRLLDHPLSLSDAVQCFEISRAFGDEQAEAWLPVAAELPERWTERLADHLATEGSPEEQALASVRAAELHYAFGDRGAGDSLVEHALTLAPGFVPALSLVARAAPSLAAHVASLWSFTNLTAEPSVQAALLLRAARFAAVEDVESSMASYRAALEVAPGHRFAAAELSALLESRAAHEEQAAVLEAYVAHALDPRAKADALAELGRVSLERLGDLDRARRSFEAALELQPSDFDAASALFALYADQNDTLGQLRSMAILAENAPSFDARLGLLRDRARMAAGSKEAERASLDVVRLDPNGPEAQALLAVPLAAIEVRAARAALLEGSRAADEWVAVARVCLQQGRFKDALSACRRGHSAAPDSSELAKVVAELVATSSDPSARVLGLELQLERASPGQKSPLLRQIAQLNVELGDLPRATEILERMIEAQPSDVASLAALADVLERREAWADLKNALERLVLASAPDQRRDAELRLARTLETKLGQSREASDIYADILLVKPDDGVAAAELEALANRGEIGPKAAAFLERSLGDRDPSRRLAMLRSLARSEGDLATRAEILTRASLLASELADSRALLEIEALRIPLNPNDIEALRRFLEAAAKEGPTHALELLYQVLPTAPRGKGRARLLEALATELERADRVDEAVERHLEALSDDPLSPGATAAIERLFKDEARAKSLDRFLLDRLAKANDPPSRTNLALRLSRLRQRVSDPAGAREALELGLSNDPDEPALLDELARVLEQEGRFAEALDVIDRLRMASRDQLVQARLDLRSGDVLRARLNDPARAFDRYRRAFRKMPNDGDIATSLAALYSVESLRAEVGALLEPFHLRQQQPLELARSLEAQISSGLDEVSRRALELRIIKLYANELHDPSRAFDASVSALALRPTDRDLRALVLESGRLSNRWSDLARALGTALAASPEDPELLRELARAFDAAAAPDRAIAAWSRVLELAGEDVEALSALERLYVGGDDPEALAAVLLRRGRVEPDANQKLAFFEKAADIYEEVAEDHDRAADAVAAALEIAPTSAELLTRYERLLEKSEKRDALARLYEARAQATNDPKAKVDVLLKLATLRSELEQPREMLDALAAILQLDPNHEGTRSGLEAFLDSPLGRRAALALEPVYRKIRDNQGLARALERLAETADDPKDRVARLVSLRELFEQMGQLDRAFHTAARAFREAPLEEGLLDALRRLAKRTGGEEELVGLLEDHADSLARGTPERLAATRALSKYVETSPKLKSGALNAWLRVLEERADDNEALRAVVKLGRDVQGGEVVVSALVRASEAASDVPQKLQFLRDAAKEAEASKQGRNRAMELYERMVELSPRDARALDRLEDLYASEGAYEELARVFVECLARADAEEAPTDAPGLRDRSEIALRLGRIRIEKLQDVRAGIDVLADVVGGQNVPDTVRSRAIDLLDALVDPAKNKNPQLAARAAELVEPHIRTRGNRMRLVAGKEARLAAEADPEKRKSLTLEVAKLYEEINRPEMGFMALARVYQDLPGDPELGARLEALAGPADSKEELADLYEQVLPLIDDRKSILEVERRVAELFDKDLGRPRQALPHYEAVHLSKPDDVDVIAALERICRRLGDAQGLVKALRAKLNLLELEESVRQSTTAEIARILETELDDIDAALAAHRERLALDPLQKGALDSIISLSERANRPDELAQALESRFGLEEDPARRAQLLLRLGTTRLTALDDDEGAVEAFAKALNAVPGHPGAVRQLAQLTKSTSSVRQRAAEVLAPFYLDRGAFAEHIQALEILLEGSREPEARQTLLARIAEVFEAKLGKVERAFHYACRALHEAPKSGEARARVERLAVDNRLYEDLAGFYLDEIDQLSEPGLTLDLQRRVAEIYELELEDVERAITEHKRVLDMSPGDSDSLAALERLYDKAGEYASLAEIYRRQVAQTDDVEFRVDRMKRLADVQSSRLDDSAGAIGTLRRLLEFAPDDREALESLAVLLEEAQRHGDLADLLDRVVTLRVREGLPADEHLLRLARLRMDELGDRLGGLAVVRRILDVIPDHEATRDFLRERIEDALAEDEARAALEMADVLVEALARARDFASLLEILRIKVQIVADPVTRLGTKREIARILRSELKQPDRAFEALTQVLKDAPELLDVREDLVELGREILQSERVVEVFEAVRGRLQTDDRVALDITIARLIETEVGDKGKAVNAWQRVLEERPMEPEAAEALDRLNSSLGRWSALADIIERRIEIADDDRELKASLVVRLARVWDERLSEPEEAIRWYEQARAIRPDDLLVLRSLARLFDDADPRTLGVLEDLVERTDDAKERVAASLRLAKLHRAAGTRERAILLLEAVAAAEPAHRDAILGLEQLYDEVGRYQDLAKLLERQLEATRDEREVTRLQRQLGLVRGTRLGEVDEAVRAWRQVLRKNPTDVDALDAMRAIYQSAERWEDLIAILKKLIPLQTDTRGVKRIRFEMAETFLRHLNRREEAIEASKRVLDVEPHEMADLVRLEELFLAADAYPDAIKVMTLRVQRTEDPGQRIEVLFSIADLYERKIQRRGGAAQAYEKILELDPREERAYKALTVLYESASEFRKLVNIHGQRLELSEDPDERRKLLFTIIDLQEKKLGQKELAFPAACRAFAETNGDPAAQAIAERLAEETEGWEILADVYEEQVDQLALERSIELRRRLAEIYSDKLSDKSKAERHLDLVLSSKPDDRDAGVRLERLLSESERWDDVVELKLDRIARLETIDEKKAELQSIAAIEERKVKELSAAIATWRRILALDADDPRPLEELVRLLTKAEEWGPLIEIHERRKDRLENAGAKVPIQLEIAKVYLERLNLREDAIEAYREVLNFQPVHAEALGKLEELFIEEDRYGELLEVYEQQSGFATAKNDTIRLLTRAAEIREEKYRDLDAAASTLERILEIDPNHIPTLEALERVDLAAGVWRRLVDTYRHHLGLTSDPKKSVELHLAMADVYGPEKLDDPRQEEKARLAALRVDDRSLSALHGLGELYERANSWFSALEMIQKEAAIIGKVPAAVDLHFRAGRIHEERLSDPESARTSFQRALEIDSGHDESLAALIGIFKGEEAWDQVLRLQVQRAEFTKDKEAKANQYTDAAETANERLGRGVEAVRLFERALEAKPEHLPALRSLSELYFVAESWPKAEKLIELLVGKLENEDDREDLCRQWYRLAFISEKLGAEDRALERYQKSYEIDRTYLPTLEGLAAALIRAERWQKAQEVFQLILSHHRESLTDTEVVDLNFQLGDIAMRLEELDRARRFFDRALDLDPHHIPTLRSFSRLCERAGDWEEAYETRIRLLDFLPDDEKFEELVAQAELCRGPIDDQYRAIDAYAEARRLRPNDRNVLRALATLYGQTGQHERGADSLTAYLRLIESGQEKRDAFVELATISERDLGDTKRAVEALNSALDIDFRHIDAFSRIESILAKERKWGTLEVNYRRMLERLPKDPSQKGARVALWKALGELYRKKLDNPDGAKTAYQVVLKLDPEQHDTALTLAEMLSAKPETLGEAIEIYHQLYDATHSPLPPRKLYELYHRLDRRDRVLCSIGALILLRAADESEIDAYRRLLKKVPGAPVRSLNDQLWRTRVFHPYCRNAIADVLKIIYRGATHLFEGPQRDRALNRKKERLDLAAGGKKTDLLYFNMYKQLADALASGDVDHYLRVASEEPPRLLPGRVPVLFAGENSAIFGDVPARQILWTLGRQLACLRPELAPIRSLTPEHVVACVEGAIRIYVKEGSRVQLDVKENLIQAWSRELLKMEKPYIDALRDPVLRCVKQRDMEKVSNYVKGVEHTASRVGLLMCGDVRIADKALEDTSDIIVEVSHRRRLTHLKNFLLSEDHFALREHIGLVVPPKSTRADVRE